MTLAAISETPTPKKVTESGISQGAYVHSETSKDPEWCWGHYILCHRNAWCESASWSNSCVSSRPTCPIVASPVPFSVVGPTFPGHIRFLGWWVFLWSRCVTPVDLATLSYIESFFYMATQGLGSLGGMMGPHRVCDDCFYNDGVWVGLTRAALSWSRTVRVYFPGVRFYMVM